MKRTFWVFVFLFQCFPILISCQPEMMNETMGSRGTPKLGSSLHQLLETYHQGGIAEAQAFASSHNMVLQDDRVQVTIVTTEGAISEVRDAVGAAGGQYQLHYRNLLQALVPIGKLETLAQQPDIQIIREPQRAVEQ